MLLQLSDLTLEEETLATSLSYPSCRLIPASTRRAQSDHQSLSCARVTNTDLDVDTSNSIPIRLGSSTGIGLRALSSIRRATPRAAPGSGSHCLVDFTTPTPYHHRQPGQSPVIGVSALRASQTKPERNSKIPSPIRSCRIAALTRATTLPDSPGAYRKSCP